MSRLIRIQKKGLIYYVSNMCIQQAYLFIPREEVNAIILGCLARAAELHQVNIYAFNFLLNRFDMLLDAPELNLPRFMQSLQGQIATALNGLYDREGKFFEGRYFKADVLDDKALIERFNFITNGPVQFGLVDHIDDWEGVSSWNYLKSGEDVEGKRLNRTELRRLKRKSENKRKKYAMPENAGVEEFKFKLAKLPQFKELGDEEYCRRMREIAGATCASLRLERAKKRKKYMGMKKILELDWTDGPEKYHHPEQKLIYGADDLKEAHALELKAIIMDYAAAMRVYVENVERPEFPPYTCRPALIDCEMPEERPAPDDSEPEAESATNSG
jgi:hypothetical protein